jgi:cobyrinic acid a,c-diamide synthase
VLNFNIPRIVVSGFRGGGGKTILSLCLIACWNKRAYRIIPFKKGPDYIDAGWLSRFAGTPCFNLDLFMMPRQQVLQSFISHTKPPPFNKEDYKGIIAIIEGNRGLYDGVDHAGTYSTAQLAKLLDSPVIIIVDCTKVTNTAAAMLLGLQTADPDVKIKGVVLNRIATSRQENLIRRAITERCQLPVLGAIPRLKHDPFPERHMGLTPHQEHLNIKKSLEVVEDIGKRYLDLDGIWKIASNAPAIKMSSEFRVQSSGKDIRRKTQKSKLKIGVIKDSAFQFYYQENLEELEKRGVKLIEINVIKERLLPKVDALYIGGGFPETHALALAENVSFKRSLFDAVEKGLPVYAECGGLMFLGKEILLNNRSYPMTGILPVSFSLDKKPQAHGYTIVEVERKNPYFPLKTELKGHEFHYSKVINIKEGQTYMAFNVKRGRGIVNNKDGLCYKNVLATYTHLHALGSVEWVEGLIGCASKYQAQR